MLFGAACLLLWVLTVRLVLRPLLGDLGGAGPEPGQISLRADETGLPRGYDVHAAGEWTLTVLPGPPARLQIEGEPGIDKSVSIEARKLFDGSRGWRAELPIRTERGRPHATLFAVYLDETGEERVRAHGPPLELTGGRQVVHGGDEAVVRLVVDLEDEDRGPVRHRQLPALLDRHAIKINRFGKNLIKF